MNYIARFKGLPKQVYLLGALRMFVGIGTMCFSFASLVMTGILGMSSGAASIVVMVQALINALGTAAGGRLADTKGRRKTYLFFAFFAFVFFLFCGFFCRTFWLIPFLFLASFCSNACGPAISAMVADFADEEHRVECFSFLYMCVNLGFSVGPTIGGMLFYRHLPLAYVLQGAVYLAVGIVLFHFIEEVYDPAAAVHVKRTGRDSPGKSGLVILLRCKPLLLFIVLLSFTTMCYAMTNFMLPLQMNDYFGLEVSAGYAGRIWTINGLVVTFFTPVLVSFVRKNHHFVNSSIAVFLYAIGFGMYAIVKEAWLFFVAAFIWSVGEILISTGAGTFIASQSPPSHLARFQSYYEIARFIGRAISPPLCAAIMKAAGYGSSWMLNAVVCLAASAIFIVSYTRWKKTGEIKA